MMTLWPVKKVVSSDPGKVTSTRIINFQLLYDRFYPNFYQNGATEDDNKSVLSTNLEIVCQDHFSERVISQLLSNRYESIFSKNDNATTEIVAFVYARPHFLTSISASSTWMHTTNHPYICGSPL